MRMLVERRGLAHAFELDSAGTSAHHAGELPDPRSRAAARRRRIELEHRARGVVEEDFRRFDHLVAMDASNLAALTRMRPHDARAQLALLRSFDPTAPHRAEVPDPYYGGADGFEEVLDLVERACAGLLERLVDVSLDSSK
jgi:protein-tyrosine phosphatase